MAPGSWIASALREVDGRSGGVAAAIADALGIPSGTIQPMMAVHGSTIP